MVSFTTIALLGAFTLASALPTATTPQAASPALARRSGATHRVEAGFAGTLRFEPENIVAEIGDLVEVHFAPANHSFAQSSFAKPCVPIDDNAIFSGFQPATKGVQAEAPNAFTIEITDKLPKWFYCSQTKGNHCQMGMSLVINQNFDGGATLAQYKKMAAWTGVSVSPPKPGNGGTLAPPSMPFNGKA
ncbi:extracellular serine-rich protein [Mytilinidion resinicola]|uniref:Extracellular serine-rich protein n=1 Tax=Mytilinidion resinicola TaxID=574789 RepID=A0A6A6Z9Y0_9PEZI|nr:extracellular serine-rich protein [Mytilinidion resinicola]KAF2817840.1 extracellular serine-rich protein [Mytilinidion resinicola]